MARRSRPTASTGPSAPRRMAANATGMLMPSSPGRLTSRRRDTPVRCTSRSSSSILLRVSSVTVSMKGQPTHCSALRPMAVSPRATLRITPAASITRAMSPAIEAKVFASVGASPASAPRSAGSTGLGLMPVSLLHGPLPPDFLTGCTHRGAPGSWNLPHRHRPGWAARKVGNPIVNQTRHKYYPQMLTHALPAHEAPNQAATAANTGRGKTPPHAVVIGSGFGGLAAAVRLGARG